MEQSSADKYREIMEMFEQHRAKYATYYQALEIWRQYDYISKFLYPPTLPKTRK